MMKTQKVRKTAILTLVLASVIFTAGAGQAMALDHDSDGDFGSNVVINMLDRMADFFAGLSTEVADLISEAGSSITQDGSNAGSSITQDGSNAGSSITQDGSKAGSSISQDG